MIYNSLKVESTKEKARQVQKASTKVLLGNQDEFVITKTMQFIPNKPTQFITQEQLMTYAIYQNRFCTETTHKRILGLKKLDIPITKTNRESTILIHHLFK